MAARWSNRRLRLISLAPVSWLVVMKPFHDLVDAVESRLVLLWIRVAKIHLIEEVIERSFFHLRSVGDTTSFTEHLSC